MFNYPLGTGGIYRSDDGGQTWLDLGYDQHPDFHALAFDPKNSDHILMGNDGGVWYSAHKGGRLSAPTEPLSDVDWDNLNGTVDPTTAGVTARTGLQIGQLTSIANVPQIPGTVLGRHPGQRHDPQINGYGVVVRYVQRRRRPGAGRPDR